MINRHFWKIAAGFLGIVAFGIGTLVVFEYWRDYEANEALIRDPGGRVISEPEIN